MSDIDRYVTDEARIAAMHATGRWSQGPDDGDMEGAILRAALPSILAQHEADLRARSRRCGCAWCCAGTPPDKRGDTHKQTCSPRSQP